MDPQKTVDTFARTAEYAEVDAARLRAYVDGPLVKPAFDEHLRDFVAPRRRAAEAGGWLHKGGPKFGAVYAHIQRPKAYAKFTAPDVDKRGWDALDHEGFLLFRLLGNAQEEKGGLFYERHRATTTEAVAAEDEWMARRLWYVVRRLLRESRLRPGRFGAVEEEGACAIPVERWSRPDVLRRGGGVCGAGWPGAVAGPGPG